MLQFTARSMSESGYEFLHLESASASLLRRTLLSSSCSRSCSCSLLQQQARAFHSTTDELIPHVCCQKSAWGIILFCSGLCTEAGAHFWDWSRTPFSAAITRRSAASLSRLAASSAAACTVSSMRACASSVAARRSATPMQHASL